MLAITTDSFTGYGLDRAFELAKKAGLEGIEVVIRHGEFDTQNPDYLNELSKRHGLPIIALSTQVDMSAEKAKRVIELAGKVGAEIVTLTPPDIFDFNYKKWLKEEMPILRRKQKVKIALVNPPTKTMLGVLPKYAFNDILELKKLDDIAFDTSNVSGRTESLLDIYGTLKSKIRHVHLANTKHEMDHTLLASGSVPLESFLIRLARDEFKGALTLKINPKALKVSDEEKVLANIEDCRKFVEKYFRAE
jgi:sugar phosphate isomerase/epimerase